MPAAYSSDLRERVWRAYEEGGESQAEVAELFGVSLSFVRDLSRRVRHRVAARRQNPTAAGGLL